MADEAFTESQETETRKYPKSIKLSLKDDGSIDWDSTSDKHTKAFIKAVEVDPNGILDNIKEQAGTSKPDDEPSGIADASVLTAANLVMSVEAIGVSMIGPKFVPVLSNLHPVVALKACSVSMEELKPVMPAAKRIMKRYIPVEYLGQEYQDLAIVGEHLLKLSTAKFKACIDLAMEIEKMKVGQSKSGPNGKVTIIDGEGKVQ